MASSKKPDPIPTASKNEAIHKHLQTQFEGLIIKFTQEIDEISQNKEELRENLESLKQQLNTACKHFGHTKKRGSMVTIDQFCKSCDQAIDNYKKIPKCYSALARNGIARETMDNIVARFTNSINSAINYTKEYNDLCEQTLELSTTLHLLQTIKAKFVSAKVQFTSNLDDSEDKEYTPKPPPPNGPKF